MGEGNERGEQARFDLFGAPHGDDTVDPTAAEPPTYSVGELAGAINDSLRRSFGEGVWVRGEIDGLRPSGPHRYFSLVEKDEAGKAVLNVSLFAPAARRLEPLLRRHQLTLANGMNVRVFGYLDYYGPNGRLGLKMTNIDPRFTLGELSVERDAVIGRLGEAGLLAANSSLRLATVPLRIGVVTSVGSAAWHDFQTQLESSGYGFALRVIDTRVQGDGAVESVAAAISQLGADVGLDAIVVIRGGGARNELAVFDAEPIALAIAHSSVPVLTGLGHEIDRAVADETAHTALKTPTAVAVFLTNAVGEFLARLDSTWHRIGAHATRRLDADTTTLTHAARTVKAATVVADRSAERLADRLKRVEAACQRHLGNAQQHLSAARGRVGYATKTQLGQQVSVLDTVQQRLTRVSVQQIDHAEQTIEAAHVRVRLADPALLLSRGWSISRDATGSVIRSASDATDGTVVLTTVADGTFSSRVFATPPPSTPPDP